MHRKTWDDLRFVLAVADAGSLSAAARALGVNHATVLRRVLAFEESHGAPIFERTKTGYVVPPDRRGLVEAMRAVEAAVLAVDRRIEGARLPLTGTVRVTSTDTFCEAVLPQAIAELHAAAPELRVELISANAHLDLARLDADVAVRPATALPKGLSGTVAAQLGFAVYAAPGAPDGWLGLSGPLARSVPAAWLADEVASGRARLVGSADSFISLRELAASGLSRAILPCILGDTDSRLARLDTGLPPTSVDIWVASHSDLADVPRIRMLRDHLTEALFRKKESLLGAGARAGAG